MSTAIWVVWWLVFGGLMYALLGPVTLEKSIAVALAGLTGCMFYRSAYNRVPR